MKKIDICSHTIVKNGASFIEICLRQILPYMKRSLVSVDTRSNDGTIDILKRLEKEFPNLEVDYFTVGENWQKDTTDAFNKQLKRITEKWILAMDDDEYWMTSSLKQIFNILEPDIDFADAHAFFPWYLVDWEHIYSVPMWTQLSDRVYRNHPSLKWVGTFPPIKIAQISDNYSEILHWKHSGRARSHRNISFIHLSLLKNSSWRKDINAVQNEVMTGNFNKAYLKKVPPNILEEINNIKKFYKIRNNKKES